MRILYGIQGTGNGHITRGRAIAAALCNYDVEVDYLFSGRERDKYFDMEVFGDYRTFSGLTFATKEGKINHLQTILNNKPLQLIRDIWSLDLSPYDLIITDFEPVTAWAGRLRKRRVVGLGHQYAFHYPIPQHYGSAFQQLILKNFAPASVSAGMHWHHFGHPIFPPIAPIKHQERVIRRQYVVVYLPFESIHAIRQLLRPFTEFNFSVYHPDATPGTEDHIHWHRPGRDTFQHDLAQCEGVICNAGFELTSEVLQLGRKVLVKPVFGQSEQYSNVRALEVLGYGHVMHELNHNKVEHWLESACATRIRYPDVADAISRWLVSGADENELQNISERLWAETDLPDMTPLTRTDNELKRFAADHT